MTKPWRFCWYLVLKTYRFITSTLSEVQCDSDLFEALKNKDRQSAIKSVVWPKDTCACD